MTGPGATRLVLGGLAVAAGLLPAAAAAQPARNPACAEAEAQMTRFRTGRAWIPAYYPKGVAIGDRVAKMCRNDDRFLLAYSQARVDLSKDVKGSPLETRTAAFNNGMADLERIRARVVAGKSDLYEIFSILGLIYYDTNQYEKSLAVLEASAPFFNKIGTVSRRNIFFTRGMAQYQLGKYGEAASSFAYARKFGHPSAAAWESKMRLSTKK